MTNDNNKKNKKAQFLSKKEIDEISKQNRKEMNRLEKLRKSKDVSEDVYLSEMKDNTNILEVEGLKTHFFTDAGIVKSVDGVTFNVPEHSVVGIVGESGCGKSVTSLSILQLVQAPIGQIVDGSIRFKTNDYKKDMFGQAIPVYETETDKDGNTLYETVNKEKQGEILLSKTGKPLYTVDANGYKQPLYDIIKDEDGEPIYEEVKEPRYIYTEKLDKKNNKLVDKEGNAILIKKQKVGENGLPAFVVEDKTFDIAKMPKTAMGKIRGREISMIFQEPMTSLNPVLTIGDQLDEVTLLHSPGATKEIARQQSIKMLELVGIAMPANVCKRYPHQLSGGMRQRVMIAMALICKPKLIIADEPTTALDVTIQAQILELLKTHKDEIGCSIMLITHDLGVIAEMADYVVVMYAGRIVEMGTVLDIFKRPLHPYTIGLHKSIPSENHGTEKLFSIPGQVPNPISMPNFCYFKDRCRSCMDKCDGDYPQLVKVSETHSVSCYLYEKFDMEAGK